MEQRNSFNLTKAAMQNKRQNLSKTEQSVKTNFKMAPDLLKWKNSKLMKVAYVSEDHARKFGRFFRIFYRDLGPDSGQTAMLFRRSDPKYNINFDIETLLGTKI